MNNWYKSKLYYNEKKRGLDVSFNHSNSFGVGPEYVKLNIEPLARQKFADYVIRKVPLQISQDIADIDEQLRMLQTNRAQQLRKLKEETQKIESHLKTFAELYPELFI